MHQDTNQPLALLDVWTHLSANDIVLDKEQMDSLQRYHSDLTYWNERVNMVSRKDIDQLWERHIIHSLLLLKYVVIPDKARVLDLGTGGGLPGIPLKIARPDIKITLVDSTTKKVNMVKMFGEHTGLKDIHAVSARVEDLCALPKYKGSFDVIVSRAVAPIVQLISWSLPLVAREGFYALLKGGDMAGEIKAAEQQFSNLSITEMPITAFGLPIFTTDEKKVIVCRKR